MPIHLYAFKGELGTLGARLSCLISSVKISRLKLQREFHRLELFFTNRQPGDQHGSNALIFSISLSKIPQEFAFLKIDAGQNI